MRVRSYYDVLYLDTKPLRHRRYTPVSGTTNGAPAPKKPVPSPSLHRMRSLGSFLIVAGVVAIVFGLFANAGWLSWFGRLPGDIRIERGTTRVYIPIVSMILVSIVLSLLLRIFRRF